MTSPDTPRGAAAALFPYAELEVLATGPQALVQDLGRPGLAPVGHLQRRETGVLPEQPGAEHEGSPVGGAGTSYPHGGQPRPAEVLHQGLRAGGEHLELGVGAERRSST